MKLENSRVARFLPSLLQAPSTGYKFRTNFTLILIKTIRTAGTLIFN